MPLRDHFRPPVSKKASWEGFHAVWPTTLLQHLRTRLPTGFIAEPRVRLGTYMEIDVAAYETDHVAEPRPSATNGGVATAVHSTPFSVVAVETEPLEEYEYAVHIYDAERERTLVAAIELVSPANKDRPTSRNAFVGKCAALLRSGVAVSVVDLVSIRQFNLYAELLAFIGHAALAPADRPSTYAGSCRAVARAEKTILETYLRPLEIDRPLPAIPLWLAPDLLLPLELEPSYEQACRDLWIA
jgi:hypothetical protein